MKMSDILKNMAQILTIAELAGPEAAKGMIENQANKAVIENTETVIKRLSDAQKRELQQDKDDSKVTDTEQSQEVSSQETGSSDTTKENQNPAPEINDTIEISQGAQMALEAETPKTSTPEATKQ